MSRMQQEIITIYFNQGAPISWVVRRGDGPEGLEMYYGRIECEVANQPGVYYVRGLNGLLAKVRWENIRLADGEAFPFVDGGAA